MAKVLEQINSDYKGRIETKHIYLEDNPDIAKKYSIRYVQTMLLRQGDSCRDIDTVAEVFSKHN